MRHAAAYFILLFALVSAGCSEEAPAPTKGMKLPIDRDATQKDPKPAAGMQSGFAGEEMSKEWIVNRLVDISRYYFREQEEALNQNLPFEEFRDDLQRYMTDRFIDQEELEQYYDGGIGMTRLFLFHYEPGTLRARTTILDQTEDRIVVKTMWFANELNSGYYEISTLLKSGGAWLLDEKRREETPKGGFQLTIQEAETYLKNYPYAEKPIQSVKFAGNQTLEDAHGEFAVFYQFDCDGETYYISPIDGYVLSADLEHY
ncbi:hypothetical protein EDM59_04335 [Brevibacillus nitrificans]|uniref:DUF4163 domain-containing protein n=1 Tax=Brevibacillus nitrificans TaxID=651560 RepID=A0A3M8DL53_9BACL|nr:hypothetical protein [Brevibacillus nitrificans]RNB88359.1 hypothetical protein EDM59_04335 [Brevibacillus nitrificans]